MNTFARVAVIATTVAALTVGASCGTGGPTGAVDPCALPTEAAGQGPATVMVVAGTPNMAAVRVVVDQVIAEGGRLSVLIAGPSTSDVAKTCLMGHSLVPAGVNDAIRERARVSLPDLVTDLVVSQVSSHPSSLEDPIAGLIAGTSELRRVGGDAGGRLVLLSAGVPQAGCLQLGQQSTAVRIGPDTLAAVQTACPPLAPLNEVDAAWAGLGRGHSVDSSAGALLDDFYTRLIGGAGAQSVDVTSNELPTLIPPRGVTP